jgi:hypothetical protein
MEQVEAHVANSLLSFIPPQERAGAERINDLSYSKIEQLTASVTRKFAQVAKFHF